MATKLVGTSEQYPNPSTQPPVDLTSSSTGLSRSSLNASSPPVVQLIPAPGSEADKTDKLAAGKIDEDSEPKVEPEPTEEELANAEASNSKQKSFEHILFTPKNLAIGIGLLAFAIGSISWVLSFFGSSNEVPTIPNQ